MLNSTHIFFLISLIITKIPKITNSEDIYEIEIIKNKYLEGYGKGKQAHYIAYSPERAGFNGLTTYILFPSLNTNEGKRTAFIAVGIRGKYGYLDMGIMNNGTGWKPYYNDNGDISNFGNDADLKDAKIVGITIEFLSNNKIKFAIGFRELDYSIIQVFDIQLYVSHIFEYDEEHKPIFRFYRFASLVNDKDNGVIDNQNDGTFMINGSFSGFDIVVNGQENNWDISGEYVEASWKVSSKRVDFSYTDKDEIFSIKHYYSFSLYLNYNIFICFILLLNIV